MSKRLGMNLLFWLLASLFAMSSAFAQDTSSPPGNQPSQTAAPRPNAASTSNTTTSNDTLRAQQMSTVQVNGQSLSRGGGLMSVQEAPKAVSTITREAIEQVAPGANFTQMIGTIPGVNTAVDDVTGLANGHYSIRGFDSSDIGMTVNGAPITDSGSYSVYATEYGDTENMGDITVLQGIPDVDMPDSGASGGHIAWATIDPTHTPGVDISQSLGSNDYTRTFIRVNTGDVGDVRSWLSYSVNDADKWRGDGDQYVTKIDGKSLWTINDDDSISASLQYNRERTNEYRALTIAQEQQNGYNYDYTTTWIPLAGLSGSALTNAINNDKEYYGLFTNPFRSATFSMDGEFKLSDSLHLSVIPYFQYGDGGGGGSGTVTESTSTTNEYGYANQDVNNDGAVIDGSKGVVYSFSEATTYRPGVIAKFNQDLGTNDSLEYGFWYEQSRKQQHSNYGDVDADGNPADLWDQSSFILYPSGQIQEFYNEYTNTKNEKGFITNNWTPNDQWTFVTGISYLWATRTGYSYDYPGSQAGYDQQTFATFDNTWHKFLPTVGIKFQLDDRNQFYIGSGKTFRVPTNTVAILDALVGTANENPETAWNTDIGWRYYGDALSVSADIYHSTYFNKQEPAYNADNQEFYTAIPHMNMQGFNGEASYKFAPSWTAYTSYTYTQAKIKGDLDGGPGDSNVDGGSGIYPTDGKTMPDTAKNIVNIGVTYDDKSLWGTLFLRSTSSLYGDYMNTERVGGFTTLNFNSGYRFADWDWLKKPYVKLNVYNLTDRHAFSYVYSPQLLATSGGALYPELYASSPSYGLLQTRAFMVTFGASFF